MITSYQRDCKEIEKLIRGMDLPAHHKKVENGDDIRWLARSLPVKNSKHINFNKAMELVKKLL